MGKDIKIIKKENDEITLQEVSRYKTFYSRYGKYIVLLFVLSLFLIGGTVILSLKKSNEYVLDNPGVDVEFPDEDDGDEPNIEIGGQEPDVNKPSGGNKPSTGNKPNNNVVVKDPEDVFDDFFGVPDDVCFKIKEVLLSDKKIYFYSDYSVKIVNDNGSIIRVLPVDNKYSVDELGNINKNAKKATLKVTKKEKTMHGNITYYSDFSAEVEENGIDVWVGKKDNIKQHYITDNKISYSNDIKEYKDFSVTYYNDGTVFINNNINNEKYFVRNKDDVFINENSYLFHYDNAASIISIKKLDNGFTIYYLSDGGAIIEGLDGNVSVRKSNSIVIENNKLIKINVNNEIEDTDIKNVCDYVITYYDNGVAVVKKDNKIIGYIPDNSSVQPINCLNENDFVPVVSTATPDEKTEINVFADNKALVSYEHNSNNENTDNNDNNGKKDIMDDKDNIVLDNGVVTIINSDAQNINLTPISITNNTSNNVKIRIVLESSENTTLQTNYLKEIKYKLSEDMLTKSIDNNIWEDNGYILYEVELVPNEKVDYLFSIWLDYANLGNDAMDRYFCGTLKVYSWEQK